MPETTPDDETEDVSAGADVSVDLGGDDADGPQLATEESATPLEENPDVKPRQQTDAGISKEEIEKQGRKQAKQAIADARGESREVQINNAVADLEESIKELSGELQHRRQQASRIETKRSGLELTIQRLESGANEPERTFTRELEGGITEEILPDEREEFAERYQQRREQLGETHEEIEQRCDALSKALERTEYARQELTDMQDLLSGTPDTDSSSEPTDEQLADALGL